MITDRCPHRVASSSSFFAVVAGTAAVVPPNTPHSVRIIGRAEIVVADFPVRRDLPGVTTT